MDPEEKIKEMNKLYKKISNDYLDKIYMHRLALKYTEETFPNDHFKKFLKENQHLKGPSGRRSKGLAESGITIDLKF